MTKGKPTVCPYCGKPALLERIRGKLVVVCHNSHNNTPPQIAVRDKKGMPTLEKYGQLSWLF